MKKYKLISFVFVFVFVFVLSLLAFNLSPVNAYDSGCSSAGPYSTTTGELCNTIIDKKNFSFEPISTRNGGLSLPNTPDVPCSPSSSTLMLYNCGVEYNGGDKVVFYWKTDKPSSSFVMLRLASSPNTVFGLGPIDAMPYTYTTEHRIRITDFRLTYGTDYKYTLASSLPGGGGASSPETIFKTGGVGDPSSAVQSFIPFGTNVSGITPIQVEYSGNWDLLGLYVRPKSVNFGPGGLGGEKSWRPIEIKEEPGSSGYFKKVIFNWDTRNVPNGVYDLLATSKVLPNFGSTTGIYSNVTVNNPTPTSCEADSPCIDASGVVNSADYLAQFAFGSMVTIFGNGLANTTASATTVPLPTNLAGTEVWFGTNGTYVKAPLSLVSANQINLQIPYDLNPTTYPYSLQMKVVRSGKSSPIVTLKMDSLAPGIFAGDYSNAGSLPAMLHASPTNSKELTYVNTNSVENSVHVGEIVMLYTTGLGIPYDPAVLPGQWASGVWPLSKLGKPAVTIGGVTINDDFNRYAFRAPGFIGIDQINFKVPSTVPEGLQDIKVCSPLKCSKVYKVMVSKTPARWPDTVKMDSYASNSLNISGPSFNLTPISPAYLINRLPEDTTPPTPTSPTPPNINTNGVVHANNYSSTIRAGDYIAIFGQNLNDETCTAPNFSNLTISLCGVQVLLNGVALGISYVSPLQVNAYIPPTFSAGSYNIAVQRGTILSNNVIVTVTTSSITQAQTFPISGSNNTPAPTPAPTPTPAPAPAPAPASTLTITTPSSLPKARVEVAYPTINFGATGGPSSTYRWSVLDFFPPGMSFTNTGSLSGIPYYAGTYVFNIQVISGSKTATKEFTLTVDPATTAGIFGAGSLTANAIGSMTNISTTGQVNNPSVFNFTQLLKKGSQSIEVLELQKFLNKAGYDSGIIDGKFGTKTEAAIIRLQFANNLKDDGIVGPLVRDFLNSHQF